MIALDSSALVAFALNEPEGPLFGSQLRMRRCLVGAPTLLETTLVLSNKPRFDEAGFWRGIERLKNIEVVAFDERCLQAARAAFGRYGKGRHPAGLNFGDCMAYAVAKVHGAPLLFKGRDFLATDIEPAVRP